MTDTKIMELFKSGNREKAFIALYKLFPRIEKLILSNGGTKDDAHDVFQESIIILNRNLEKSDFQLTSSFYTYLYAVAKYIYRDQQKQLTTNELHNLNQVEAVVFDAVIEEQKYKIAEQAFRELGDRCQHLLKCFYIQKLSFNEIAQIMQFKSEKIAKNQKYKCLKKAKDIYKAQILTTQTN